MWEPFTERARRSIVLAQEEAQRIGTNYIGTEHLLLGIMSEGESVAAKVLERLGLTLSKLRKEVEANTANSPKSKSPEVVFTPRAKKVIEIAYEEARSLSNNYIGTEHLLLGLIKESEGVASRVLNNLGIDINRIKSEITNILGIDTPTPQQVKEKTKTPTLDQYSRDLTKLAREKKSCREDKKIILHYWVNQVLVKQLLSRDLLKEYVKMMFQRQ